MSNSYLVKNQDDYFCATFVHSLLIKNFRNGLVTTPGSSQTSFLSLSESLILTVYERQVTTQLKLLFSKSCTFLIKASNIPS